MCAGRESRLLGGTVDDLSFLLRNGYNYGGRSNWTTAHMNYLRHLTLPDANQKIVLEEYIQAIDAAEERVARLEEKMDDLLKDWEWKPIAHALMAFKGFKKVAVMITLSELGDLTRFPHPRQLMGYLGLVPSEESSGSRRRQGAITKCGNSHARWLLIESAQAYRHPAQISAQLSQRQEGQSRAVKELSWKAQNRLHNRYLRLKARGKHENKVKVAVARELCAFVWELHRLLRDQLPASAQDPSAS
jgi:transposase